MHIENKIRQL